MGQSCWIQWKRLYNLGISWSVNTPRARAEEASKLIEPAAHSSGMAVGTEEGLVCLFNIMGEGLDYNRKLNRQQQAAWTPLRSGILRLGIQLLG